MSMVSTATIRATFVSLCLSSVSLAHAQPAPSDTSPTATVPPLVRVDGVFAPADGLAPAAVETVTLALYAEEAGDTPALWLETQEVRVDAQGRYVVFLGASSTEGLPLSLFAAGERRWLGMRFARPGEGDQPRVLLASVPYALRSSDAATLGGLPPSAFLRADGAAEATEKGALSNRESAASTERGALTPSVSTGTANFIGKFTNAVDLTSSALFDNAGKIGLGTTSPLDFVHTRFTDITGGLTGIAVQNLGSGAASYSGMLFYDQNGALGQFQGFNNSTHEYRINNIATGATINFMTGSTSRFLVRNDGDVDISGNIRKGGARFLHNVGQQNLGVGLNALGSLSTGIQNAAVGDGALGNLTSGCCNVAVGWRAFEANNSDQGVAIGLLSFLSSPGFGNIGLGAFTGADQTAGTLNMYLGYSVGRSVNESNTVRIGDSGSYNRFFVGAVRGVTTGVANAVPVMIDGNGQLGTVNSSRRYKDDIQDMGEASSGLMKLRPVTYRYQQPYVDGSKPIDYGLIAEEVEEVYPDLVAHLANGEVETVQYHKINAMLLNEVQKQHRTIEDLKARLAALESLLATEKP